VGLGGVISALLSVAVRGASASAIGLQQNQNPLPRRTLLIAGTLYWIQLGNVRSGNGQRVICRRPKAGSRFQGNFIIAKGCLAMTYLDVVFPYGANPGESELRAIDGMREVYGVLQVLFNEKDRTVRVKFDASRLKREAVARLLRQAGIDVGEPLALA
jgi:hypothetical protein